MELSPLGKRKIVDISGQKFGKLVVLGPAGVRKYRTGMAVYFRCRCDCGNEVLAQRSNLRRGNKTCGCEIRATSGPIGSRHPLYKIWSAMIERCNSPSNKSYKDYGDRGITVSKRWMIGENNLSGFECFILDMGQKPSPSHSIERMNNDLGYGPDNCSWGTRTAQNRNKRSNRLVSFKGRTAPLSAWCAELGLPYFTISRRLRMGWPHDRALTEPIRPLKR